MDDINNPQIPSPAVTPPPSTDLSSELAHVTQEMYKKNLELAEKNKTLSLLRKIDEIVLGAVTDTKEIAQQVVDTVVAEGDVKAAVIYLIDKKSASLFRLALSQTEEIIRAELEYNKKYHGDTILLSQTDNLMVTSVLGRSIQSTEKIHEVLRPVFSEVEAAKIQDILGVTKTLIYPLIVRNDVLGIMVIDVGEKDELLSNYQKELIDRLAVTVGIAVDNSLLYQNIQMANARLKELDKLKDEFVSLASHELRTPMTAIKSYIWMLIENKMIQDPKGNEYLNHAYEATDRLINLVNDMLNVSRIESGRMIINLTQINLGDLITDVIAEVHPVADKQGITIEYIPSAEMLPQVQADANKIKEVLINLIGNSIKFTPSGGKISIAPRVMDSFVVTSVSDTGKGLLPEDLPTLFTKFGLLEKNYATKHPAQGTGLGLYICKSIIEMHGGKITVTSEGTNKGTTFTFSLKPIA